MFDSLIRERHFDPICSTSVARKASPSECALHRAHRLRRGKALMDPNAVSGNATVRRCHAFQIIWAHKIDPLPPSATHSNAMPNAATALPAHRLINGECIWNSLVKGLRKWTSFVLLIESTFRRSYAGRPREYPIFSENCRGIKGLTKLSWISTKLKLNGKYD